MKIKENCQFFKLKNNYNENVTMSVYISTASSKQFIASKKK